VRAVEIPGVDHLTILYSEAAAREIALWLERVFAVGTGGVAEGRDAASIGASDAASRAAGADLEDPRLAATGVALAAYLVLIAGVGLAAGRLAPLWPLRGAGGGVTALCGLALASVAALPVLATGIPGRMLSIEVAEVIASQMALAGFFVLGALALAGPAELAPSIPGWGAALRGALAPALAAFAAHRLVLTPDRAAVALGLAAFGLPFWLAFEWAVRRGGIVVSSLLGIAGRVVFLAALALGLWLGVLPPVVALMVPSLAVQFALFELFAGFAYGVSGNWVLVALTECLWLAWLSAAMAPLRIG
jgi:hypothetical protein